MPSDRSADKDASVCISVFLHVMWKHLEQRSFALTEQQYQEQLDAVAELLQLWGVSDTVRAGIAAASPRGPGYTAGGSAKAVSIPRGCCAKIWTSPLLGLSSKCVMSLNLTHVNCRSASRSLWILVQLGRQVDV